MRLFDPRLFDPRLFDTAFHEPEGEVEHIDIVVQNKAATIDISATKPRIEIIVQLKSPNIDIVSETQLLEVTDN